MINRTFAPGKKPALATQGRSANPMTLFDKEDTDVLEDVNVDFESDHVLDSDDEGESNDSPDSDADDLSGEQGAFPENGFDEEVEEIEEDDDLLLVEELKSSPTLSKGEYQAVVGKPLASREKGKYGTWIKIIIPFHVKVPHSHDLLEVRFIASKNMDEEGRLFPIVKGILGRKPEIGMNLKEIAGRTVNVIIDHYTDDKGKTWEQVVSARK